MTSFWVSGAVTAGLFGRLGDMFGKRLMILLQLLLFTAGALACAVGPSLAFLIGGRVLMGCAVGMFPLAYSLIQDELPPKRVVGSIALIGGLVASGAAVGQSLGGLISDTVGFRWIFWISLVLAAISIGALLALVPESPVRTGGRVDVVGGALFAAGLAAPLIAIAEIPTWGWAGTVAAPLRGRRRAAPRLRIHERRVAAPLIDLSTLLLPRIRLTNASDAIRRVRVLRLRSILSQFFQVPRSSGYGLGASATEAGLYLVPGLLLQTITAPFAGRLSNVAGPVFTFRLGIAISHRRRRCDGDQPQHRFEMFLFPAIVYIGMGAMFGSMPAIILQAVPTQQSGQSAAINMILRTAGSAIGIQLAATLITTSIGPTGTPSDVGYTAAFAVATRAGIVALILALRIPRKLGPAPEALHARLAVSPSTPA